MSMNKQKSTTSKTQPKRSYRRRYQPKKSVVQIVRKELNKNIETKYYDRASTSASGDTVDYSGSAFYVLTTPSQGTTDLTRVGDKVRIRGLHCRMNLFCGDSTNTMRVILYQYKQASNLIANSVTYLLNGTYVGTAQAPNSPYVHDYQKLFNVLYDKTFALDLVSKPEMSLVFKCPIKYARKEIAFSAGSTDAINHIYLLVISDSGAATHPSVQFVTRFYYDDA